MRHRPSISRPLNAIVLLLGIVATTATQGAAAADNEDKPQPADVYILSGQSNMVGSGVTKELADKWKQPIQGAYIYKNKQFVTVTASGAGRFGPEISFAHYLINNQPKKHNIYLIKFAISGQPLDAGWGAAKADGGGWAGPEPGPNRKTFYPGTSPDDRNIGLHYQRLHAHITKAMQTLKVSGMTPQIKGIVWMQGEADAKHEVSAGRYDRTLSLLKKRLEQDFAQGQDVPLVFGQVLPHEPAAKRFIARDLIRQRMAEADWRSESDRAVNNIWMVPTEGMELKKDTVHYSTNGVVSMGQAFGLEMLKAHRKAEEDAKQ